MVHGEVRVEDGSKRGLRFDLRIALVDLGGTLQDDVGVCEVSDLHVHDCEVVEHDEDLLD
jgi:hypothetical protein